MAPRQNTFTVIPNAVGLNAINSALPPGAAAKPPMTSKQAKKLYKQANRQPKLSKAEQRRRDLMEQDRIRKEFEEEGRRARARAAREKKKLKEEQQREEKRKRGLPLVEVHPSQDTIARFVRGFTPAKKPEAAAATPRLPSFEETTETLGDGVDRSENGTVPDKAETSDPSETVENDRSGGTEGEAEEPQAKRRRTSQPSSSVEPDTTGLAAKAEKKPTKSSPNASKGKIPEQDSFSIDPAEAEMLARLADVPVQAPSVTKEEPPTPRILPQPSTKAARPPLGEISANAVSKTDAAGF
ncbi:hypothetical protein NKR23_g3520 [Pleurostoma richardsiae]|uniref:Uncharacterized protein n=1 Tax=Pleurostoma richardsiae TaxID=41990 RepID=A0AA38RYT6_9PEZI|nr:hypothetical protein NKR23_g3520 [Pleurostoma richardsiae]